jgi:hypothetical protein
LNSVSIPVIDYRRHRMTLQWHAPSGSWTDNDEPPAIVHGVCFVRASGPKICLYADAGQLRLQIDAKIFPLTYLGPRISCGRTLISFGLRRRFRLNSADGEVLFSTAYWVSQKNDFFAWLASMGRQANWHERTALRWTEGLNPADLRAEVNPPAPPQ